MSTAKVKSITFKQIKNLGNYENVTLEVTVECNEDTPEQAIELAKKICYAELKKHKGSYE